MQLRPNRRSGFTLVEIMTVSGIISLLAILAIPGLSNSRAISRKRACINNLRQIDAAKQQWALENKQLDSASPGTTDLQPYLGRNGTTGSLKDVFCPADSTMAFATSYQPGVGNVGIPPICGILGIAQETDSKKAHVLP